MEWPNQTVTDETDDDSGPPDCTALVELAKHMLIERKFEYVLLGQFQFNVIEQRFEWYRQLSANYFGRSGRYSRPKSPSE